MPRTILVVDDVKSNREILKKILGSEYDTMEAGDGREALAVMRREIDGISAVILDLGMPVMDGFAVLEEMRQDAALKQLPVIVTTGLTDSESEEKALELGAKDYISKPYKSAIIRRRIRNTISLRETAAAVNALKRDALTGLYSRAAFFEKTREMVESHEAGYYIMACFDIDKFKVVNDQYGTAKGDEALCHIARVFDEYFEEIGGISCRISGDDFAVVYPAAYRNSEDIAQIRRKACNIDWLASPLVFRIGRYLIDDTSLSPSAMYDRAIMAADSVKGRYDEQIALYDKSMRNHLIYEQEIVNEMEQALSTRQFETWFQPQYNHSSKALIGAEALVRWRHPQKGLIAPFRFVPVFEQNGFIYELDKYVWESACVLIRKWIDGGLSPVPVSVNISRYDVFRSDVIDVITGLVEKYGIPADMLRLEITESAFASDTKHIVAVVKRLIAAGFTLEIDDFGSGYSSLNTLKSVPAQVLKLDMRFFEGDDDSPRGGSIVESIVRMTKWLGMSVIAEGVEKKEQADFLRSIGCNYIQGYLYAKPMPEAEYEALLANVGKEETLLTIQTVENLDNNSFWDPQSMDTLIFNSYVGGACIYEYHDGNIELLRATEKYAQVIGSAGMTVEDALKLNWAKHMAPDMLKNVITDLEMSIKTRGEVTGEYVFLDLPNCPHETYLRSTMRVIASAGDRYLVYCTNENITAQRKAETRERILMRQLQALLDSVNCGVTAVTIKDDSIEYLLTNGKYFDLLGYTKKQYEREIGRDAFSTIYPDDRKRVGDIITRTKNTGIPATFEYRAVMRDGGLTWLRSSVSMTSFEGVDEGVQLSTYTNITAEKHIRQREKRATEQFEAILQDIGIGITAITIIGGKINFLFANDKFFAIQGYTRERFNREVEDIFSLMLDCDRERVRATVEASYRDKSPAKLEYRIVLPDGAIRWVRVSVTSTRFTGVADNVLLCTVTDITNEKQSEIELLDNIPQGAALYSYENGALSVIHLNKRYWELVNRPAVEYAQASFMGALHPDDRKRAINELNEAIRLNRDFVSDLRICYGEGEYRVFHIVGRIVRSGEGKYSIYASYTPVNDEASYVRDVLPVALRAMMAAQTGFSFVKDKQLRYMCCSRSVLEAAGLKSEDEIIGKTDYDILAKSEADAYNATDRRVMDTGESIIDCGDVIPDKNGLNHYTTTSKYPLKDSFGEIIGLYGLGRDVTDQHRAMERLRVSEVESRLAIEHSGLIICRYTIADKTARLLPEVARAFGIPETVSDVPDAPIRQGLISPDSAETYKAFYNKIISGEKSGSAVYKERFREAGAQRGDKWRWMRARFSTIFDEANKPISAIISFFDVTEEQEKEAVYKKWQQSLTDKDPSAYTLFRCNLSKNASFDNMEGTLLDVDFDPRVSDFEERTKEYVSKRVYDEDKEAYTAFMDSDTLLANYYRGKRSCSIEYREIREGADPRWLKLSVDMIEYPNSTDVQAYLMYENITDTKVAELETRQLAQTDPLTGVLNRAAFISRCTKLMSQSRPGEKHALLMLDIDGFKLVNDVFGHGAGDQTLIEISAAVKGALRHDDLLGRLGGDEFMVFLKSIPSDAIAAMKARQICALSRKAFSVEVQISASIGIAVSPRDGSDFASLYKKVDSALYYVKGSGKDNFAFYREDMKDEHLETGEKPDEKAPTEENSVKRRMLIVDDSVIDNDILTNIFKDDFIIEKARDGSSALIRLRHYTHAISVVLLDLMMPGMDGFQVLDKMRSSAELQGIPVIVVSGDDNRDTCLRTIRSGASDFITKPVDPELLRIRVLSAISKAENERLRAQNSFLQYENSVITRYKTVMLKTKTVIVEYDIITEKFIYDQNMSELIAGVFDGRGMWKIFADDKAADMPTIGKMCRMVDDAANDAHLFETSENVTLRTPSNEWHAFKMSVYKTLNEFGQTGKLYITFRDIG